MENKKRKLAVAYCRVSTDDQADNGLSLDVQQDACVNAIQRDGFTLLKIIRDEGKSAGNLKRSGIKEVIQLAIKQEIDALYAVSSDRLARNTFDHLYLRDLSRKNKVEVHYVYQPMMDDSAMALTMDTVMASFNEMHRLVTSEKVKTTMYAKAGAGYFPTHVPPGYKNVSNPDSSASRFAQRIIIPDPHSAPLMIEAFLLYATGNYNVYDLNDLLYEKGLRATNGGKLSPSRMYELLKNRIYIGEVHWGEIHVKEGKHKPLIDRVTFDAVQTIMAGHNKHACRRRKYTWLLNGFIWCRKHQRRYTAEWHLKKRLAYYHCPNRTGCDKYIETMKLENWIAEKFKDLEFSNDFIERIIEKARAIFSERRRTYETKKQSLVNVKTAWERKRKVAEDKLFEGVLSDEDFTRVRNEIKTETASIDEQIAKLEKGQDVKVDIAQEILRFAENIYKAYCMASPTLKRMYLGFFWERFEMADGIIIESCSSPLFQALLELQKIFVKKQKTKNPQNTRDFSPDHTIINSGNWLPSLDKFRTVDWKQILQEFEWLKLPVAMPVAA